MAMHQHKMRFIALVLSILNRFQYFAIILVTLCVCSEALPSSTFLWEFAKKYHRTNIILHVQNDTAMRMTKKW